MKFCVRRSVEEAVDITPDVQFHGVYTELVGDICLKSIYYEDTFTIWENYYRNKKSYASSYNDSFWIGLFTQCKLIRLFGRI